MPYAERWRADDVPEEVAPNRRGQVAGIVLAAGAGRRVGLPKALVEIGGRYLLQHAVEALRKGGCSRIVVVLGAHADEVQARVALPDVEVIVNDRWADGLSTSFAAGLRACEKAAAVVVMLVDQPGITSQVIRRIIETSRDSERSAVVATYGGAWRNPVLFKACVFHEVVAAVHGDAGAKPWLQANAEKVETVEVGDIADATDVDNTADLLRARARFADRRT